MKSVFSKLYHFNMIMDGICISLVFVTVLQVFCSNTIAIYGFAYAVVRNSAPNWIIFLWSFSPRRCRTNLKSESLEFIFFSIKMLGSQSPGFLLQVWPRKYKRRYELEIVRCFRNHIYMQLVLWNQVLNAKCSLHFF